MHVREVQRPNRSLPLCRAHPACNFASCRLSTRLRRACSGAGASVTLATRCSEKTSGVGPSNSIRLNLSRSISNAIRVASRASPAPRQ